MKTRTFLWAAALCAAALLLARCAEEQIPVQPEIPVEELAEDPETRSIEGLYDGQSVQQGEVVTLTWFGYVPQGSLLSWDIFSYGMEPGYEIYSEMNNSLTVEFTLAGEYQISAEVRDWDGYVIDDDVIEIEVVGGQPNYNFYISGPSVLPLYEPGYFAIEGNSNAAPMSVSWDADGYISGIEDDTKAITFTLPGQKTISATITVGGKEYKVQKQVGVYNLSAPLIGLNHRDQISTPEGFGVNVANTSWPVTVSMFDHSGDPNATYEWIVPPGVILTDGNRFPLNRPLQPTDKTVYALHPAIGTYLWQGRIRYGNGQVTEWGQRTVTVVADPLPPAPFKIRFETEYSFYVNIMIELEHGGYVDLLGETSETYGGYTPYEYEEWVDLPPGNHILYFSTEGGAVNEARPFSLPEDGAEYYFYYGTWGHGGSPTLSSGYSRF